MPDVKEPEGIRQPVPCPFRPLDDGHAILRRHVLLVPHPFELIRSFETIQVEVIEPNRPALYVDPLMFGHEGKRGTLDCFFHTQPGSDPLRDGRFPGAQVTVQKDDITRSQSAGKFPAEPNHRIVVGNMHNINKGLDHAATDPGSGN